MRRNVTIINYYGSQDDSRCGYCGSNKTSQSNGLWAHCMTVRDYQDLIDRGWRRSGQYCYKPNNATTCCPSYTIKCDALAFNLSKSHKKIIKKMNNFLTNGHKGNQSMASSNEATAADAHDASSSSAMNMSQCGESSALAEYNAIIAKQPKISIDLEKVIDVIDNCAGDTATDRMETDRIETDRMEASANVAMSPTAPKSDTSATTANKCGVIHGPDPTKPPRPKAKVLRQQRKLEKNAQKGNNTSDASSSSTPANIIEPKAETSQNQQQKAIPKNAENSLESFVGAIPSDGQHKLEVKLVPSSPALADIELDLYRRYQMGIHRDPFEKVTRKNFETFLLRTPLKLVLVDVHSESFAKTQKKAFKLYKKYQTTIHHDPPSDIDDFINFLCASPLKHETPANGPRCGFGSFHQQYWLDGKLVAVGVIDILPKCVSSVYFFYDPDYSFLTLGTYGTLREIQFIRELNSTCQELSEYYMGFYIHTCPKMRYKGKLQPSYLLCPEVYTWHLLNDDILSMLNQSKYCRFNTDATARDLNEFIPDTDLNDVRLLPNYRFAITYRDYKEDNGLDGDDSDEDEAKFTEYGLLVGRPLSRRLFYVI